MKVAIFDRDADKGEKVAAEIGGIFCHVDVTSDESVDAGFARAREAHGQERICVNCAGVANAVKTVGRDKETGAVKRYPIHQFELAIQINLIGTFRVLAASAAGMATLDPLEDGEKGLIVNTASVAAQDGQIGQAAYSRLQGRRARHGAADRPRPDGRGHPRQHHPARHLRDADDGDDAAERPRRARRAGALPEAARARQRNMRGSPSSWRRMSI